MLCKLYSSCIIQTVTETKIKFKHYSLENGTKAQKISTKSSFYILCVWTITRVILTNATQQKQWLYLLVLHIGSCHPSRCNKATTSKQHKLIMCWYGAWANLILQNSQLLSLSLKQSSLCPRFLTLAVCEYIVICSI